MTHSFLKSSLSRVSCAALAVAGFSAWAYGSAPAPLQTPAQTPPPASVPAAAVSPTVAPTAPFSFAPLASKVTPAVVNISTTQIIKKSDGPNRDLSGQQGSPLEELFRNYLDGQQKRPRKVTSLGSGFIIDAKGHIVTNNHVIADADKILVNTSDGTEYEAKVVGRDPRADLALLKISAKKDLPFVSWGDSEKALVGDWVMAVGNPFGFNSTVTAGIISSRARDIQSPTGSTYVDDFIQTDAAINMGNSGGPMFNMQGDVIGVNTAIASPSGGSVGIGFAVPSFIAKDIIDQLLKYGHTKHGWIGVRIQEVSKEIAQTMKLDSTKGALVADTTPDGPAAKAGLQSGDVILTFNATPIENSNRLPRVVGGTPIGSEALMEVWRNGKKISLKVKVGDFEKAEKEGTVSVGEGPSEKDAIKNHLDELGFELADITPQLRARYKLSDAAQGALIVGIKRASPAGERGLLPGDIIVSINQQRITKAEQASGMIKEARKAGMEAILLSILRGKDIHFVALRFDEDGQEE